MGGLLSLLYSSVLWIRDLDSAMYLCQNMAFADLFNYPLLTYYQLHVLLVRSWIWKKWQFGWSQYFLYLTYGAATNGHGTQIDSHSFTCACIACARTRGSHVRTFWVEIFAISSSFSTWRDLSFGFAKQVFGSSFGPLRWLSRFGVLQCCCRCDPLL